MVKVWPAVLNWKVKYEVGVGDIMVGSSHQSSNSDPEKQIVCFEHTNIPLDWRSRKLSLVSNDQFLFNSFQSGSISIKGVHVAIYQRQKPKKEFALGKASKWKKRF